MDEDERDGCRRIALRVISGGRGRKARKTRWGRRGHFCAQEERARAKQRGRREEEGFVARGYGDVINSCVCKIYLEKATL